MSLLKRLLGIGDDDQPGSAGAGPGQGETASVRRIAGELERMPPEQARHLAAFAYVLARVAHADLQIDEAERASMREIVAGLGKLSHDEATLVCELACDQSARLGGSENYVVTREFRKIATLTQRVKLLECLFAVAASDGEISTTESHEVIAIAEELGFTRPQAQGVRLQFREHLAELRSS